MTLGMGTCRHGQEEALSSWKLTKKILLRVNHGKGRKEEQR
jgi:hypothetical protein